MDGWPDRRNGTRRKTQTRIRGLELLVEERFDGICEEGKEGGRKGDLIKVEFLDELLARNVWRLEPKMARPQVIEDEGEGVAVAIDKEVSVLVLDGEHLGVEVVAHEGGEKVLSL